MITLSKVLQPVRAMIATQVAVMYLMNARVGPGMIRPLNGEAERHTVISLVRMKDGCLGLEKHGGRRASESDECDRGDNSRRQRDRDRSGDSRGSGGIDDDRDDERTVGLRSAAAGRRERSRDRHRFITSPRHLASEKKLKLDKFDGTGAVDEFLEHFNTCAKYNRWGEEDKLVQLKCSLKGSAAGLLKECRGSEVSSKGLAAKLKQRFDAEGREVAFRAQLSARRRRAGESLQALHIGVSELLHRAYPGSSADLRNAVGLESFVHALDDPELQRRVRNRDPQSLDAAYKAAVIVEANTLASEPRHPSAPYKEKKERYEARAANEGHAEVQPRVGQPGVDGKRDGGFDKLRADMLGDFRKMCDELRAAIMKAAGPERKAEGAWPTVSTEEGVFHLRRCCSLGPGLPLRVDPKTQVEASQPPDGSPAPRRWTRSPMLQMPRVWAHGQGVSKPPKR